MKPKYKNFIRRWIWVVITIALIPFLISLSANLITWLKTRDYVEISFKLDGWITIGSVQSGEELPNLKLVYNSQPIKNILKLSWKVINSGNQGIEKFETGPFIEYPVDTKIAYASIIDTSPLLKIKKQVEINKIPISIDSLGIFNKGDYFRIDFYLIDIEKDKLSNKFFGNWKLKGKSLNLNIKKDISVFSSSDKKETGAIGLLEVILSFVCCVIALIYSFREFKKSYKFQEK